MGMTWHASKVADRWTGESHELTFRGNRPSFGVELSLPTALVTPREYYACERLADHKSEYRHGIVVAMTGKNSRHARIGTNLIAELNLRLRGRRCSAYTGDLRINVQATGLRTYPDASVFCGRPEFDEEDDWNETAINPTMLFEVLSDSTEAYDRGAKAEQYRRMESLLAYVHINQGSAHVEHFESQGDGTWSLTEASGRDSTLWLPVLGIELPLADLYDGAELDEPPCLHVAWER
jgi:Uma2 family endonuclease